MSVLQTKLINKTIIYMLFYLGDLYTILSFAFQLTLRTFLLVDSFVVW